VHVWVNNELADSYPKDNFLFGIYGGIYRNIRLVKTGNIHIGICDHASTGVYINPKSVSADKAIIKITTMVKNDTEKKQSFTLVQKIFGDDGMVVAEQQDTYTAYPGGMVPFASIIQVDQPRLWNGRKDPFLYELETSLLVDGKLIDKVKQAYGFRYFEIDPDRGFLLNGQAYRLYGVCRHQEWQDLGNALLPVHHRTDMLMINELGVTSVRLAHYQQAEYIYRLADSLGILVWAEIPFVNGYNKRADGNAKQQLGELIKQNFNHPSIFVWGVHNEVIKGDVVMPAVNLSRELHDLAKQLDPNRFTVAVSNIWWVYDHPIHENTDLQGFNQYTGWYGGQAEDLEKWISKYHKKKPDIRISVSEYGAGGNIEHQTIDDLSKPDPTGQFFPEGYQTRYHEVTWSAIERSPFIWASYVWNMFDFSVPEWDRGGIKGRNHKGLVTYDRKIKKDAYYWYMANWSEDDVLHLCGKRNSQRPKGKQSFKAYSNAGAPELLINGKSYGKMTAGINEKQYLLEDIKLREGDHTIEIRAEKAESKLRDSFILRIDNDKQ
jgi:beta-galactosidase